MTGRRVVGVGLVVMLLLVPVAAGGFAADNVTRVTTSGTGALAVASCQLILLANAFAGANTAESGLDLKQPQGESRREPYVDEAFVTDNASASCEQNVPRVDVTLERSPSWGAPAPESMRDGSFAWHGTRDMLTAHGGAGTAGTPDTAMNLVDARIKGSGNAVAVCQLLVGVDLFIAAGPVVGTLEDAAASALTSPGDTVVNATQLSEARCATTVHSLRIHFTS